MECPDCMGTLRLSEAARRIGVPTRVLIDFIVQKKIPMVMRHGIAHIDEDVAREFRVPDDYVPVDVEADRLGAVTLAEAVRRLGVTDREMCDHIEHRRFEWISIQGVPHVTDAELEAFRRRLAVE